MGIGVEDGGNTGGEASAEDTEDVGAGVTSGNVADVPKKHSSTGANFGGVASPDGGTKTASVAGNGANQFGNAEESGGNNGAPFPAMLTEDIEDANSLPAKPTGAEANISFEAIGEDDGADKFGMPLGADANISIEAMSEDSTSRTVGNGNGTMAGATGDVTK